MIRAVFYLLAFYAFVSSSNGKKLHLSKRTSEAGENAISMADVCGSECRLTELGVDYLGRRSVTISGRTCQRWSSQYPHEHTRNNVHDFPDAVYNEDNFCRNPDHESGVGPWCYTTDPDVRWETCGIPLCPECRTTPLGVEYRGHRVQTISGKTCQRWDSQYPHSHSRNDVSGYPDAIHNEDNFCRNPDHESTGPWCYTTDPDVSWESCGVPVCKECRNSMLGTDYRGQRSVTISGRTCQRWDSQSPHHHSRNDVSGFPDAVYNSANYCRNPDHEHGSGPWCYTNDPLVRWESCGIPLCPGATD